MERFDYFYLSSQKFRLTVRVSIVDGLRSVERIIHHIDRATGETIEKALVIKGVRGNYFLRGKCRSLIPANRVNFIEVLCERMEESLTEKFRRLPSKKSKSPR